jgi:hypothetical protein
MKTNAILLCYDGQLTEDSYFRGWKQIVPSNKAQIEPIYVKSGGNPLKALKETKKVLSNSGSAYKEVWCITDTDGCAQGILASARNYAAKNSINLALSCRCFELWIKLHFQDYDRAFLSERDAITEVQKDIPNYGAPKKEAPFSTLYPRTPTALDNCSKLRAKNIPTAFTDVDRVVGKLASFVI